MPETVDIWKRKRSKPVADCRVFKVREDVCERDIDRTESTFFVVENPDWVNVIAMTRNRELILIEQFRHGIEEVILELPGGMIDDAEAPETAARRELLEETGFSADRFVLLGTSHPNPAIQNNMIHHFLAIDCEKTQSPEFDEHESVLTKIVSLEKAEELIAAGAVTHSLVVAAFHYFSIYSRKEK